MLVIYRTLSEVMVGPLQMGYIFPIDNLYRAHTLFESLFREELPADFRSNAIDEYLQTRDDKVWMWNLECKIASQVERIDTLTYTLLAEGCVLQRRTLKGDEEFYTSMTAPMRYGFRRVPSRSSM